MQQQRERPPHERLPDDGNTRVKREDRINDQRSHHAHPDDDRLTEADLDRHDLDRREKHARSRAVP